MNVSTTPRVLRTFLLIRVNKKDKKKRKEQIDNYIYQNWPIIFYLL
jgi:hypothetical protein